jgi:hypothetical protein
MRSPMLRIWTTWKMMRCLGLKTGTESDIVPSGESWLLEIDEDRRGWLSNAIVESVMALYILSICR